MTNSVIYERSAKAGSTKRHSTRRQKASRTKSESVQFHKLHFGTGTACDLNAGIALSILFASRKLDVLKNPCFLNNNQFLDNPTNSAFVQRGKIHPKTRCIYFILYSLYFIHVCITISTVFIKDYVLKSCLSR